MKVFSSDDSCGDVDVVRETLGSAAAPFSPTALVDSGKSVPPFSVSSRQDTHGDPARERRLYNLEPCDCAAIGGGKAGDGRGRSWDGICTRV